MSYTSFQVWFSAETEQTKDCLAKNKLALAVFGLILRKTIVLVGLKYSYVFFVRLS